jgi:5-formyltetrahydrofolate cyclo-ligase
LDKAALRSFFLAARQNVADRALKERQIAQNLTTLFRERPPKTLGLYHPIQGEVDLSPFWKTWPGMMALPTVVGDDLIFRAWHPGDPLTKGPFGIPEPLDTAPPVIPDTLLVPCLGVDAAGHRLGYGRGYYDRYLAEHPGIQSIGVVFLVQIIPALPAEKHDQRLSGFVMEELGVL